MEASCGYRFAIETESDIGILHVLIDGNVTVAVLAQVGAKCGEFDGPSKSSFSVQLLVQYWVAIAVCSPLFRCSGAVRQEGRCMCEIGRPHVVAVQA